MTKVCKSCGQKECECGFIKKLDGFSFWLNDSDVDDGLNLDEYFDFIKF